MSYLVITSQIQNNKIRDPKGIADGFNALPSSCMYMAHICANALMYDVYR